MNFTAYDSRIFAPALICISVIAFTSVESAAAAEVLRGARIYVSPDAPVIDDGVVIFENGKISAAGPKASVRVPAGAQESTCSGGVIVAGFQNSHVHFTGNQFTNARSRPGAELDQALKDMLTRYGVTTAVDTGSDRANTLALRSRIEGGEVPGPRILTVGIPLYPPDGIPFYLEDLPKAIRDQMPQPRTPEAAIGVVGENIKAGTDGTKLFIATPQRNQVVTRMPPDVAAAAVEETHRRGKLAMTHPTDIAGVLAAVTAHVDIVLHTTLGETMAWPDELVRDMVKQNVSLVPTLQLWPYELKKSTAPESERQKLIAATQAQLKGFAAAGGQVLFGTDVGYMTEFDPTAEYDLMSKSGLTPLRILASLTTAPGLRWKETSRRGTVERGKDADLVVLESDPASDVRNFAQVRCTIRGGKTIYKK